MAAPFLTKWKTAKRHTIIIKKTTHRGLLFTAGNGDICWKKFGKWVWDGRRDTGLLRGASSSAIRGFRSILNKCSLERAFSYLSILTRLGSESGCANPLQRQTDNQNFPAPLRPYTLSKFHGSLANFCWLPAEMRIPVLRHRFIYLFLTYYPIPWDWIIKLSYQMCESCQQ